ncbi:competence protein ComEC [Candidatus Planktophila lacus]|uniref:ComEC/Rec2 family competence protein n=1 Tax=Candidatus Planktophila lacus TaxID=1884913 RepID=UPI000BACB32A|nr:ComEC/Rec2 family competence protein [Candidatus Planktophila lacus]ASY28789.1 competence protein ComEC [Candidatus Planktophila lacus]
MAPWRISLGAICFVLLALSQKKRRVIVLVIALTLGSVVMSMRQQSLESSAVANYFQSTVEVRALITTDPQRTAKRVSGQNFLPPSYSFLASLRQIDSGSEKFNLRTPVRIITSDKSVVGLLPGQWISLSASVLESKEARTGALLIARGSVTATTEASSWAKSLAAIRLGLRNASGSGDGASLIPGMVLGDTSLQSDQFKSDMRRSGLTHLVAVSGANFAIVSAFVLWCMQFLFRSMRFRIIATAIALICFIALVRPSPSVLRAAAMAAVLLISYGTRRGADSLPALGFAIALVVVGDPWQAREPGFALSVLATAGLLLYAPRVTNFFARGVPKLLAQAAAPPIAAMVFCAPVIVALSGFLSPASLFANLFAAPAVAPITITGFIAALISPLFPQLSTLLITCVKPLAIWIAWVADWAAGYRVLTLQKGLIGFLVIAVVIALFLLAPKRLVVTVVVLVLSLSYMQRFPAGQWQVANCDIGQGDGAAINLGNHRAIVIDTGPDPELIDRCLKQLGVREIPLLIITHGHADHIAGWPGVTKGRKIGLTWYQNVKRGARAQLQSTQGPVDIEVLWPDSGSYDPNNSSIAVRITTKDYTLFAGGDMEPLSQSMIASTTREVDIYKVCHHGSAYQDEIFTKALSPQVAMISVGAGNSYGHPAPATLELLEATGAKVLRTDRDGAIAISARNHRLKVRTSRSKLTFLRWE